MLLCRCCRSANSAAIDENHIAAAAVAGAVMGKAGTVVISVLIMICTFGALNACILVYPRIYYRMAQEGFSLKSGKCSS